MTLRSCVISQSKSPSQTEKWYGAELGGHTNKAQIEGVSVWLFTAMLVM